MCQKIEGIDETERVSSKREMDPPIFVGQPSVITRIHKICLAARHGLRPSFRDSPESLSHLRRQAVVIIVTAAGFLGPLAGSLYLPMIPVLSADFKASVAVVDSTVAVFMLVFALAPLFFSPWADVKGRRMLYLPSLTVFITACVLLAAVPAKIAVLFVLRVIQAVGVSNVTSLGLATVADVTKPEKRASAIAIFMLAPQLGPIIGPLIGGAITSSTSWRWAFGFVAILSAIVAVVLGLYLPETLRLKSELTGASRSTQETCGPHGSEKNAFGTCKPVCIATQTQGSSPELCNQPKSSLGFAGSAFWSILWQRWHEYWTMIKFTPIFLVVLVGGLLFASYYCLAVSYSSVLGGIYNFSSLQVGLAYMVPGVFLIGGSMAGGRVSDRLRQSAKGFGAPHRRLVLQGFGVCVHMCGLLGYGLSAHYRVHVSAIMVFAAMSAAGMTWVFVTNSAYLSEHRGGKTATVSALAGLFRNLGAGIAALVIELIINHIGYGWAFTGVVLLNVVNLGVVLTLHIQGPCWHQRVATTCN